MQRTARAQWTGNLNTGHGQLTTESLVLDQVSYSFNSRFEDGNGTNPEELLAAAHAGCFTMALTYDLSKDGWTAVAFETTANVSIDLTKGGLTGIELHLDASPIDGVTKEAFLTYATKAKENCPLSKALAGVPISLHVIYQ